MQEDRGFHAWKQEIQAARCRWETKYHRDRGALLRGAPLTEARERLQNCPESIEPAERRFIEQSWACQEREKTQQQHQWERTLEALCGYSEQRFAAGQELDALVEMVRVAEELKQKERSAPVRGPLKMRVATLLRKIVYEIREHNRLEHDRELTRVILSPDGQTVAAASRDGTIALWNLEGRKLATLAGHADEINRLAFAPNGQFLASVSENCTVKLWSLDGTELATLTVPRSDINSVVFSPNSKILATSTSHDKIIQLWNSDGTSIATLTNQAAVEQVCFSPDSRMLAAVNYESTILLWKLDGTQLATFESGISEFESAASNAEAQRLAVGSDRATMMRQRRQDRRRQEHSTRVRSVAFSPDGQVLFAGTDGGTIERWQIGLSLLALENVELPTLKGHTASVNRLVFSPDGQTLASSSEDGTIKLWNPDGSLQGTLRKSSDYANMIFSPNAKKLFDTGDRHVKVWNLERINAHQKNLSPYSLLEQSSGNWLISFSPTVGESPEEESQLTLLNRRGKTIELWNSQNPYQTRVLKEPNSKNESAGSIGVAFSPDGQIVATVHKDNTVKLWGRDDTKLATLTGHSGAIDRVSFSPNGRFLATASQDKTIKLWNREGTELATFTSHESPVIQVVFSPDGQHLASVDGDGILKLWQFDFSLLASDGVELHTFTASGDRFSCVSFSPDSQMLVAGNDGGTIELLALDGTKRATFAGHGDRITNLALAPDGQTLASSSGDRTIKLWQLDGTELGTAIAQEKAATYIAFHPDGSILASASQDGSVKLLQLDGKEIATFHRCCCCDDIEFIILNDDGTSPPPSKKKPKQKQFANLAFSPDGQILADTSSCSQTHLWNLDLEDLLVRSRDWLGDYLKNHPQAIEIESD